VSTSRWSTAGGGSSVSVMGPRALMCPRWGLDMLQSGLLLSGHEVVSAGACGSWCSAGGWAVYVMRV
jgi:hypothetical protein